MKDKRFLTGLGSGLIAGAILLQLMNVAASGTEGIGLTDNEQAPQDVQYTAEQLTEIADRMGYVLIGKDEKRYTEAEVAALIEEAAAKERESAENKAPTNTDTPVKEQPAKPAEETPATEQQPADKDKPVTYAITIKSGMSSDAVADALVAAKLIADADEFKNELSRLKIANKIQVGTFTFEKKPTLSEIINKITKS